MVKIIEPYYVIEDEIDGLAMLRKIEKAGRTCYKSEELITDESAPKFVRMVINRGHESVIEHEKLTVRFICNRGFTHEEVRHRLCSYSQESTRYCNYGAAKFGGGITVIRPPHDIVQDGTDGEKRWVASMEDAERNYFSMLELYPPEIARGSLPIDVKTEIVHTANLREWRLIFTQRTAPVAHPQMRQLMRPLLDELKILIPVVFDDIIYEGK